MPTNIELSCLNQGYSLPRGLTSAMVAERLMNWGVHPSFVPIGVAPGCVGWGIPLVDGKALKHELEERR